MLGWGILFLSAAVAQYITRNGNFESSDGWFVEPVSAWCDQYCTQPSTWQQGAHSGTVFVLVRPSERVTLEQTFNRSNLAALYDACKLSVFVRVIGATNVDLSIVWNSVEYGVDWYGSLKKGAATEWTELEFELSGVGDALHIDADTGGASWLALDDMTLYCYHTSWLSRSNTLVIILICAGVLLVFSAVRYLLKKSQVSFRCCRRRAEFIALEPLPEEEAPVERRVRFVINDEEPESQ
jgi:hypothetical protein